MVWDSDSSPLSRKVASPHHMSDSATREACSDVRQSGVRIPVSVSLPM